MRGFGRGVIGAAALALAAWTAHVGLGGAEGARAAVCLPGAEAVCYTERAGTLGVGICKAGRARCDASGDGYGACLGQVSPQVEDCSTADVDESCDGQPACTGEHRESYVRPPRVAGIPVQRGAPLIVYEGTSPGGARAISISGLSAWGGRWVYGERTVWSARGGDPLASLAAGPTGELVLAGTFFNALSLPGRDIATAFQAGVIAVYDPEMRLRWARVLEPEADGLLQFHGVGVDRTGDVIVLMSSQSRQLRLEGQPIEGFNAQPHVLRFSAAGELRWSRMLRGPWGQFELQPLLVDAEGNAVLIETPGEGRVLFAKLDPEGRLVIDQEVTRHAELITAAALDGYGNVILAGRGDFVDGVEVSKDAFLMKLDPLGRILWTLPQPGIVHERVAADPGGYVVAAGRAAPEARWEGEPLLRGTGERFIAKYDPRGRPIWVARIGDGPGELTALTAFPTGDIFVAGTFSGRIDLGGQPAGVEWSPPQEESSFIGWLAP